MKASIMFYPLLQSWPLNSIDCVFSICRNVFFRGMALPRNQCLHPSTHICGKRKAGRAAGRPSYRTEQASVTTDRTLMHDGMRGGWQSGLQMSKLKQQLSVDADRHRDQLMCQDCSWAWLHGLPEPMLCWNCAMDLKKERASLPPHSRPITRVKRL